MKKTLWCAIIILLGIILAVFSAAAIEYPVDAPYETYTYDQQDQPIVVPTAFSADRVITGRDFGEVSFKELTDVFFDGHDRLYFCDAGANRIVVTDARFGKITELNEFVLDGEVHTFSQPTSVWSDGKTVYVADSANSRIVVFDVQGDTYVPSRILSKPIIAALEGGDDYIYTPTRLSVDSAGRVYVIATGINQGMLCLDENGNFTNFFGAPRVQPNLLDMLWRRFATKAQLEQMESYVPTEYSSLVTDAFGFLYVTSQTSNEIPVGKLNTNGENIMKNAAEIGDMPFFKKNNSTETPYITDIALGAKQDDTVMQAGKGVQKMPYYIVDSNYGKVYAYSGDGLLLYAFGANGTQQGTLAGASAVECLPGDRNTLLIADRIKGTVTVFKETAFAASVRRALSLYDAGRYDEAIAGWNEVLRMDSGYVPAIIGLAKIELQEGDYQQALGRLKSIHAHELYSDAFEMWREAFIRAYFIWIIGIAVVAVVVLTIVIKLVKKWRPADANRQSEFRKAYKYGTYVMFHPFDGFWDLKREKRGNMKAALTIVALAVFFFALRLQFSGYVVTGTVSKDVNVVRGLALVVLPFCFYVVSNWCFTTLMDGKGTMRDIVIATAYALKPYVLFSFPLFILSHVLTASETVFYTFADSVCILWVLALLFIGLMVTHDYTPSKTVLTVLLILVGICLIIFILLLLVYVVQDVYQFVYNSYKELAFRNY